MLVECSGEGLVEAMNVGLVEGLRPSDARVFWSPEGEPVPSPESKAPLLASSFVILPAAGRLFSQLLTVVVGELGQGVAGEAEVHGRTLFRVGEQALFLVLAEDRVREGLRHLLGFFSLRCGLEVPVEGLPSDVIRSGSLPNADLLSLDALDRRLEIRLRKRPPRRRSLPCLRHDAGTPVKVN